MDDRYDNINAGSDDMNGRSDYLKNADENDVFAQLFALDQQPDPTPQFVRQLGASLMPSARKKTSLSTTTLKESNFPSQPLNEFVGVSKRRRPIISFGSAAILMVIVVLVGYLVTLWAVDNSENPPAYLAYSATVEASSTAAAIGCYVEPRDLSEIALILTYALYGIPSEVQLVTPLATADTRTLAQPAKGSSADDSTVDRVTSAFEQYVACWSIGDNLRTYALFSDDGIARTLAPDGVASFYRIAVLARQPHPDIVSSQMWNVDRIEILSDGRAVLYVVDAAGQVPGLPENYVIFKEIDGHWLIEATHLSQG